MKIQLLEEYPYLYEGHLHTCQASACAVNTGYEMAKACKEFGYTGIFVTDHNWGGNTCIDKSLPWKEWIKAYTAGYYDAKRYGDSNDFDVFFGMETGFFGTEFLIYGLTAEWFIESDDLRNMTIEEQYKIITEAGGMVSQAHPFRVEYYIPEVRNFPEFVDAFETSNATHSSPMSRSHNESKWDDEARELAAKHNKPQTAGSDVHSVRIFGGGMAFKRRLTSSQDFKNAVLGNEDYILSDGLYWRDKMGKIIADVTIR